MVGPIYEKAYFVTAMNGGAEAKDETWELGIQTRDGEFVAQYSQKGLCGLNFPSRGNRNWWMANGALPFANPGVA